MLEKIFQISKYGKSEESVLRENLRAHIIDGSMFGFALSFISINTIVPVFIQQMGGNAVAISSIPVLWMLGLNMPQALFIQFTHKGGFAKPFVLRYGLLHRYSFLVIGVVTLVIDRSLPVDISVPLLLGLIFFAATAGSLAIPPWFQLFTKTTPVKVRGRLIALRQILSSLLGVLGGSLVTFILAVIPTPTNFAVLFILAFLFSMISYFYLKKIIEFPTQSAGGDPIHLKMMFVQTKIFLQKKSALRGFLIADALILISMTTAAFYAVYAIEQFHLSPSYAGTFTALVMSSMVLGNIVFGFTADYFGHRLNLLLLAGSSAAASIIAVAAGNILVYGLVFFFMASSMSLQGISRLSFIAELTTESERPVYIAIINTVTAPALLFGIIFGLLVRSIGYNAVFLLSASLGIMAIVWIVRKIPEPRNMALSRL